MIAARFGGHFGAVLSYLGASGANFGVSEGVLGLVSRALYVKLRVTCCDDGEQQIVLKPCK